MGVLEKIKEIEDEMARTQKNKATNYHLGTLKAKLAKLRSELLIEQSGGGGGGGGEGFDVARLGDARVALIGFPSVGKSTLLSTLTETKSEAAAVSVSGCGWWEVMDQYGYGFCNFSSIVLSLYLFFVLCLLTVLEHYIICGWSRGVVCVCV